MNKRAHLGVALAFLASGALVGCSMEHLQVDAQSYEEAATTPQSETDTLDAQAPVLDKERIEKIAAETEAVIQRAADEGDTEILSERLDEGALAMRTAEMIRQARAGVELSPLPVDVNVASATAEYSFPRTLLIGSAASAEEPATVFLFSQKDAQSQYMLENWARVVGGESIRGVEIEEGTKTLAADAPGFTMTPAEAAEAYAGYLREPGGELAALFSDQVFAPAQAEERSKLSEAVQEVGTIGSSAEVAAFPVTGVALAGGQGLIAASFDLTTRYDRTEPRSTMTVGGTAAAYLEDPNVVGTVTVRYIANVFFLLPEEGSEEPIKVVGAERAIVSAERDDSTSPDAD